MARARRPGGVPWGVTMARPPMSAAARWARPALGLGATALVLAACSSSPADARSSTTSTTHHRSTPPVGGSTTSAPPSSTTTTSTTTPTTTSLPTTTSIPYTTTTTTAAGSTPLPVGQYFNAPAGQPRYDFEVTSASGNQIAGTLSFDYQDGRTATVFTFQGAVTNSYSPFLLQTSPTMTAYAVVSHGTVELVDCNTYLQYASSSAACTFSS